MRRLATLAIAFLLMGFLAACGDDDGDTSAPSDDTSAVDDSDAPADDGDADAPADDEEGDSVPEVGSGDAGTVTIDGTTYDMNQALLCDPDSADTEMSDRELELQVLGEGGNQLDVYISEMAGVPLHDVSWAGPEGIYGNGISQMGGAWTGQAGDTYADPPISVDGNRATGSVVLYDAMTMEESIELDFDVVIPSETFACR